MGNPIKCPDWVDGRDEGSCKMSPELLVNPEDTGKYTAEPSRCWSVTKAWPGRIFVTLLADQCCMCLNLRKSRLWEIYRHHNQQNMCCCWKQDFCSSIENSKTLQNPRKPDITNCITCEQKKIRTECLLIKTREQSAYKTLDKNNHKKTSDYETLDTFHFDL